MRRVPAPDDEARDMRVDRRAGIGAQQLDERAVVARGARGQRVEGRKLLEQLALLVGAQVPAPDLVECSGQLAYIISVPLAVRTSLMARWIWSGPPATSPTARTEACTMTVSPGRRPDGRNPRRAPAVNTSQGNLSQSRSPRRSTRWRPALWYSSRGAPRPGTPDPAAGARHAGGGGAQGADHHPRDPARARPEAGGRPGAVAAAKEQQAANQASRRALEKDIAAIKTRLSRYKDQLMEVKTNREYTAMQHEIETAQGEVKRLEDQMLELMLESDEHGRRRSRARKARSRPPNSRS